MQSPLTFQMFEMPRLAPPKGPKAINPITYKKPQFQPQPMKPEHTQADKDSFTSHLNQYMRHPWGVIDYYIYLAHIESGRDKFRRAKECYLLESHGFKQLTLRDHLSSAKFSPHKHTTVFFVTLPIPNAENEFTNTKLVLGFDLKTRCFQGYLFERSSPLENYEHLWEAWARCEGQLIIDIHVDRFLSILRHTMQHQIEILEIGVLHHYGLTARAFHAGLDMVILIQFLQFADDFADDLWADAEVICELYAPFQEELREVLSLGSRESWFAARDGLKIEQHRQKQLKKVVASGLFYGQNVIPLRPDFEEKYGNKKSDSESRLIRIVPGHLESGPTMQIRVLVSAVFILCFCSLFRLGSLDGRELLPGSSDSMNHFDPL
ncbi:hypothetical protein N7475_004650 [Penicillium sp. IBT 31633x]|nr:hypothetical protein N7475_004650 [Penicillium sp. IBT 31633x]